jgi:DNA topoisomerase-1
VLNQIGAHPESGAPVQVLSGRYGPYVTDGKTNASLPKTADPATFTMADAVVLLKAREEAGPAKRPAARRGSSRMPRRKAS